MQLPLIQRGNRAFTFASVAAILIGILHTAGLANDPPSPEWSTAMEAMRGAAVEIGPMRMTLYGVFESVWIQTGAMLLFLGAKNMSIVVVSQPDQTRRLAHVMSVFDCVCCASLTALFAYLQIPPPLVAFGVLAVFFLASAMATRPKASV